MNRLFGDYSDGVGPPWGERYRSVGKLLDACADEAARECWDSGGEEDVQYQLRVLHDAYFLASFGDRCVLPVPCEESTPDLSFADVVRVCTPGVAAGAGGDAFIAILEKSVPRHCATRDFTRKCEALPVARDECKTKALVVLLSALLGNFRHCRQWARASKRRALLGVYATDATAFDQHLLNTNDKQRVLLFSSFREYLSVAVAHMPALATYAAAALDWDNVQRIYRQTMDVCRKEHDAASGSACTAGDVPAATINRLTRARSGLNNAAANRPKQNFGTTVSKALAAAHTFAARRYFTSVEDARDWTLLVSSIPRTR